MWQAVQDVLGQAWQRIAATMGVILPALLAMLAILVVAALVAFAARWALPRLLARLGLDRRAHALGLTPGRAARNEPPPSVLVGRFVAWCVVLLGVALGLDILGASTTSALGFALIGFLPRLVVAAAVFIVGIGVARWLERTVLIGAVNLQIQSARLLALGVKWFVVIFATALALQHLGVGGPIVVIAFSVLLGGIVLAAALAVGLGSRETVGRAISRRFEGSQRPRREDRPVQHL